MTAGNFIKKCLGKSHAFIKKKYFSGKISRIYNTVRSKVPDVSDDIMKRHRKLWSPFTSYVNLKWLRSYIALSGVSSHLYIPEDVYYCEIEPRINNKGLSVIYTDKNHYDKIFQGSHFPLTLFRGIGGSLYDRQYSGIDLPEAIRILSNNKEFIIKPSVDSGGGRAVRHFRKEGNFFTESGQNINFNPLDIIKMYLPDFICQEVITSHDFYSRFNPSSLNTIRFLLYNSVIDGKSHILNTVLRVGRPGSVVDNQASGGYACGVSGTGILNGIAVNKKGEIFRMVNGLSLETREKLFGYEQLKKLALDIGVQVHYSHLIGLDLCMNSSGEPKMIEINCLNNEINFFQMTNGPLFGTFTEEIVAWCAGKKKNLVFDFEI